MSLSRVEKIADAVLYEGYMLYPYRPSAVKNQRRWNFGVVSPRAFSQQHGGSEACSMQTECLIEGNDEATISAKIRFLHLVSRQVGELRAPILQLTDDLRPIYCLVEALEVDGRLVQTWQEAIPREIPLPKLAWKSLVSKREGFEFSFAANEQEEWLRNDRGDIVGIVIRSQEAITGMVEVSGQRCNELLKLKISIKNLTPLTDLCCQSRDEALLRSMVSTHTILSVVDGKFVSLLDPPERFQKAVNSCSNIGTWPVLSGEEAARDVLLSSPIILYDYPQIAPESAGDLCDGTEIDEILTLRIMTLTDEEKREMRGADDRAREILERIETLPIEQLLKMHGAVRGLRRIEEDKQ